ncbi:MAG: TetR/AcrR family transcriptional regulator [Planctomycetota bacterium]
MARGPDKSFDIDESVERATEVFWSKGYAATGVAELCEAMGVGKKSLYDTFGSKRDLYLRALDRYADETAAALEELAETAKDPLRALRSVLRSKGEEFGCADSRGCFLGVALAQVPSDDPELAHLLGEHVARMEKAFEGLIRQAVRKGSLASSTPVTNLSRLIVSVLQGLGVRGRTRDNQAAAKGSLQALNGLLAAHAIA